MLSSATASASFGLQANMSRFATAASEISNPNSTSTVKNIVDMKIAEHGIKVNAAVLSATQEMSDHLIDIIA